MADDRRIEYLPLDEIVGAPRNPKQHNTDGLLTSIGRFGYATPALRDERTGRLVVGHGRTEAVRMMRDGGEDPPSGVRVDDAGRWLVPVVCGWASRSDAEAEAYLVADNRHTELGGWDNQELAALLEDVRAFDPDLLDATGWDLADLEELLADEAADLPPALSDPDHVPEPPVNPVSKLGDLWILGKHRLVCGDSTDIGVLDSVMQGELADLIWTDPPYNVAVTGGTHDPRDAKNHGKGPRIENDSMSDGDFRDFLTGAFNAMWTHAREGATIYVCHADTEGINFRTTFRDSGFFLHEVLIWAKQEFVFGRSDYHWQHEPILYGWKLGKGHSFYGERNQSTLWSVDRPMRSAMEHPTQKPVALVTKALENSSQRGEVVLDPFGGGGSTLIGCHQTGRHGRLVELDPKYVDVICRRYQEATGDKPVLAATGQPHDFCAD